MSLTVLVPVLNRPRNIAPLVDSIDATAPDAEILFLTSPGYPDELKEIRNTQCPWIEVAPHAPGDYARKMNIGVAHTGSDLIFLGADDIRFHPGWIEAATRQLTDGVGVVGTNDLGNSRVTSGRHSTHSLITREYANRGTIDDPTRLLHEGYVHEYVDDELVETAKHRNAYAHAHDAIVEHLHPAWGKAPSDHTYDAQRERMKQSRALYQRRRRLWT